jgi:hypothetical protein
MNNEEFKSIIKQVRKKLDESNEEARKYREVLASMRKICDHDWKYTGHDSHKDHYECSICGDTDIW